MTADRTLRIERTFQAPVEAVFDAWTREEVIRRWWRAEHDWETEAAVDLRVGGGVRVVMRDRSRDVRHGGGGTYTEIVPPTRLAFTWTWDGDTRGSLIELDLEEAAGVTTVRFTHSDLRDDAAIDAHRRGWNDVFDALGRTLGTGASGRADRP